MAHKLGGIRLIAWLSVLCGSLACNPTDPTRPTDVVQLILEPRKIATAVGGSVRFKAFALRRDGSQQALDHLSVTFGSTDTTPLHVSAGGVARGVRVGQAFVTASYSHDGEVFRDLVLISDAEWASVR